MIRTQVSLDEEEYRLAKHQAAAEEISVAEFIRRAIRDHLPVMRDKPWMRYSGLVETGDPHSSESVDEFVYGAKD